MATYQVTYSVASLLDVMVEADSRDEAKEKGYALAKEAMGGVVVDACEGFWLGDFEDVVYVDKVDA
jgi:uncharacterized protein YrrD